MFRVVAADFTSPTLGTQLDRPSELALVSNATQVVSQQLLPDGRTLLEARAGVQNGGEGLWSGVTVGIKSGTEVFIESLEFLASSVGFSGVLASNTTLVATGSMHLLVPTASLAAARDELLSRAPLVLHATDANGQRQALGAPERTTNDVQLLNPRVLAELPVADGNTLLVFAADVQNQGSNTWSELLLTVDAARATNHFAGVGFAANFTEQLAAFGSLSNSPPFYAAVASNDVPAAISNILSRNDAVESGF